jgi:hypothetical protein
LFRRWIFSSKWLVLRFNWGFVTLEQVTITPKLKPTISINPDPTPSRSQKTIYVSARSGFTVLCRLYQLATCWQVAFNVTAVDPIQVTSSNVTIYNSTVTVASNSMPVGSSLSSCVGGRILPCVLTFSAQAKMVKACPCSAKTPASRCFLGLRAAVRPVPFFCSGRSTATVYRLLTPYRSCPALAFRLPTYQVSIIILNNPTLPVVSIQAIGGISRFYAKAGTTVALTFTASVTSSLNSTVNITNNVSSAVATMWNGGPGSVKLNKTSSTSWVAYKTVQAGSDGAIGFNVLVLDAFNLTANTTSSTDSSFVVAGDVFFSMFALMLFRHASSSYFQYHHVFEQREFDLVCGLGRHHHHQFPDL